MDKKQVALLAEGVDRNPVGLYPERQHRVALLAEGVDRNQTGFRASGSAHASPSSRRAWIEMSGNWVCSFSPAVALLAEGVDRNTTSPLVLDTMMVALLAEGVDRNASSQAPLAADERRPPRGGRG